MKTMRMALFCALVGWMAADAQAQWGTYGSPDLIPMGQYAQRDSYMPAAVSRTSYVTPADGSSPAPIPGPAGAIPQAPSESSAVSTMLNEQGTTAYPSSGCTMMPQGGYMKDAGNGEVSGDVCGGALGSGGCCQHWYASAEALFMTRSQPRTVYTSAESSSFVNQGSFTDVNWTWGAQGTIGYRFGCNCEWAVEGTYWGLAESDTDGGPGISSPFTSPMTFGLTSILGTTGGLVNPPLNPAGLGTADQWTDNSPNHHTWRNWDAQDAEINLVRTVCGGDCNCCNRFGVDFLCGVRWFRFQDGLVWGAERQTDTSIYSNSWLYLNDRITNDLVGFQAGFNGSYRFADCWKVFFRPVVGIFNNHTTLDYNLYTQCNDGIHQGSSQTYANPNYPVHATSDNFAFLTQVDLGLDWQVTRHISTQIGYRVVAVTGVATADSQIPFYGNDTQAIANIQHDDSLLVHGAFGGLTFTW